MPSRVDSVFHALADPSRRSMVERLVRAPASVSQLAEPLAMSLAAVVQHLAVLEGAGIVASQKVGRVRTCRLVPEGMSGAEDWIAAQRSIWERRLDRLGALLAETDPTEEQHMPERSVVHATFTLERRYRAPTAQVFHAWADPDVKARWFAGTSSSGYELDFRPGGVERNQGVIDGRHITWESLYREILTDERIVYTSVLTMDQLPAGISLTTVEFTPEGDDTRLVLVEAGAYLDGHERPEWREQGTGEWLDALGRYLTVPTTTTSTTTPS